MNTNSLKTGMLFAVLITLFAIAGNLLGGTTGMLIALGFASVTSLGTYWYSDSIVLKMYKARELSYADAPQIHKMVEELAQNAGIPKPKVCSIPDQSPNAFATGRNPDNAVVAVTEGIVALLSPAELRGVIAHEIAHIANRDILIQTVAGILGAAISSLGTIAMFSRLGGDRENSGGGIGYIFMIILAPIAASLIQMAISRSREYLADESGARYCQDPNALARALNKLSAGSARVPLDANPATENMFIVSPLNGGGMKNLFSTHPPIENRVARLQEMAQSSGSVSGMTSHVNRTNTNNTNTNMSGLREMSGMDMQQGASNTFDTTQYNTQNANNTQASSQQATQENSQTTAQENEKKHDPWANLRSK